ncbi:alpha/beta fold hydrolase [Streptomyces olivochromogenes]|uniref:alpha/beta fold hydrolase n=1 Tax=Streptomyces olivochromogenes TaxID=1963 RepID=UPI0036C85A55
MSASVAAERLRAGSRTEVRMPKITHTPMGRCFDVEDGRLYAHVREGCGPALVFLYYWGGSHRTWRPVVERLGPAQAFVSHDHRGWGESTKVPGPYGMERLADDAQHVIDELGYDEYVVVGHSLGGKVAQVLASRRAPPGPRRRQLPCRRRGPSVVAETGPGGGLRRCRRRDRCSRSGAGGQPRQGRPAAGPARTPAAEDPYSRSHGAGGHRSPLAAGSPRPGRLARHRLRHRTPDRSRGHPSELS